MDKQVIFAVAGSGKTTHIINKLNLDRRFLLVTYTNNNVANLRSGIIRKFGYFPDNIKLYSYYSFLYSFCYKPFLYMRFPVKGINYEPNPNKYIKKSQLAHYVDPSQRLYSARIAKLIIETGEVDKLIDRITKYFDFMFIDEIQDFAGNDFNLLKHLVRANVNHLYVGDFFQHTFDTGRDGRTNATLHDVYAKYISSFTKMGLAVDTLTLNKSHRCGPSICEYISNNLGINIESHRSDVTPINIISDLNIAAQIFHDPEIVKLFFSQHYRYNCFSKNWGECKGEDKYSDVCVVINNTTMTHLRSGRLEQLPSTTKNKLYVALSRTKNKLYLVPETLLRTYRM